MTTSVQFFHAQRRMVYSYQVALAVLLVAAAVVTLGYGPAGWDWRLAFAWMMPDAFGEFSQLQVNVVTQIRLPRFCLAILIGMALANTGAATQALCRNPLADPSIIGVSSGAAVMAVSAIAFAPKLGFSAEAWLPYFAFSGALLVTLVVYRLSKQGSEINVTTLILIGVAINALCFALIGLVSFYADDSSLRLINYWTMGSLAGAGWSALIKGLPLLVISLVGLFLLRNKINLLLLGESEARYLGIDIGKLKGQIVLLTALGVGAAVSLTGLVGFVGLDVPHITRLLVGANMSNMLLICGLIGGFMMLVADWFARNLVTPAELPIGIVTAMIGAPVFVYLLYRQQREQSHA